MVFPLALMLLVSNVDQVMVQGLSANLNSSPLMFDWVVFNFFKHSKVFDF